MFGTTQKHQSYCAILKNLLCFVQCMHALLVCCDFTEVRQQVLAACHGLSWGPGSLLSSGVQTLVVVWSCVAVCVSSCGCGHVCVFLRMCHVPRGLRLEDRFTFPFVVSASTLTTTRSAWLVLWYHEHEEGVLEAQVSTTASTPTTSSAASAASAPQRLAAPAAMAPCEPAGFSASASIRWWIWACI